MTQQEIEHLLAWLEEHEPDYPRTIRWWSELKVWAIKHGYEPPNPKSEEEQ